VHDRPFSTETVRLLVERELDSFQHVPTASEELRPFLVAPFLVHLDWDYGEAEETRECWVIAEFPDETALGYSLRGFSAPYLWGIVSARYRNFGSDASWFASLEDCFLQTPFWSGQLPDGYEVS
jgi:hypothetical protein